MEPTKESRVRTLSIGLALVATILVLILMVSALMDVERGRMRCELSERQPLLGSDTFVHSDEESALANFVGYLKYNSLAVNSTRIHQMYMPLELSKLFVRYQPNGYKLIVSAGCAEIEIQVTFDDESRTLNAPQMDVNLKVPNGNFNACRIFEPIEFSENNFYSCKSLKVYQCLNTSGSTETGKFDTIVAELFVSILEFEGNADPNNASKNKFTRDPQACN